MDKFLIKGGTKLKGEVRVSGAKNVAMKVMLAGLLTNQPIFVQNVPLISSVLGTADIVRYLGVKVKINPDHTMVIKGDNIKSHIVPFEMGGLYRTAAIVLGPLLSRFGKAVVPNPGGCRIGKRPIDRHTDGLGAMGAKILYKDGYFYASTAGGLKGARYRFKSNTHTGTETLILAGVMASGETILENAAEEPEVDDLIRLLNLMGGRIRRVGKRSIIIRGVKKLTGAEFSIMPDRNEVVTFAVAAVASKGDLIVEGTQRENLKSFLNKLNEAEANWEPISNDKTRFYESSKLKATDITTAPHPGFMTDWQAPWTLMMLKADGISTIHETIYEDRFGYVGELHKMGARIEFFQPKVKDPKNFYNFNWILTQNNLPQAIKIKGATRLHNAILEVSDLRAGISLVLAAICTDGESVIRGVAHIDRGYENIEQKLSSLGANIKRVKEKN